MSFFGKFLSIKNLLVTNLQVWGGDKEGINKLVCQLLATSVTEVD